MENLQRELKEKLIQLNEIKRLKTEVIDERCTKLEPLNIYELRAEIAKKVLNGVFDDYIIKENSLLDVTTISLKLLTKGEI